MAVIKSQFTMRLDPLTHCKIKKIAAEEHRSLTNMIEFLIAREIKQYERENGEISCTDEVIHLNSVSTIADGIAVKEPGINTFDLCNRYVDEIVTVSDEEIAAAILYLMEKQKLVSEGAGAVSVAAVMTGKIPVKGKKVVCLVSGGNIDVNTLNRVIARGLKVGGRLSNLTIDLADKPGQLSGVCNVIANLGGNVLAINHERTGHNRSINDCTIRIELETRNHEHIQQIKEGLHENGFQVVE